jgi:acid phosphatase (class A)
MKRLALLLSLLAFPAFAGHYINADAVPPTLLAPPHAEQSEAWRRDVRAIAALQKQAAKEEIAAAAAEYKMRPDLLTPVVGATREKNPKLFQLLDRADADGDEVTDAFKAHWKTRRPYLATKDVKALIDAHGNPAYPSGHTSRGVMLAEILGELYPEQREALRMRAEEIARHRVLTGMHYPVDVEGGRALARMMLGALWQSDAFRRDFAAARAEITGTR